MKIIKRDGRAVDYDRKKIQVAIEKANQEVRAKERATNDDIKEIINYIEDFGKKRMLVEDIQDIIEQKLMEIGKYELSKKYIVYRYTRALVRKQNTTDESILGLIRNENKELTEQNSNKNTLLASAQRDYIAGEVSRDLTRRLLLPEKIVKADEEGILHFHNADYFVQPIFNCCSINISDMLEKGTVIDGKLIETPENFREACTIVTQIIETAASNQYGGQSVDLKHLGKYLRKSYEIFKENMYKKYQDKISEEVLEDIVQEHLKIELKEGVQAIQSQSKLVSATLFLHLEKDDPYCKENAMIIEEILKQRLEGIKNEKGIYVTPSFPKLVYVLDECNNLTGGEYDYLTKLAVKCSAKRIYPDYISAKKMRENKDEKGNYKFEGRFNQGVVSINLPQIGIVADRNEEIFWKELEERLELCKEALMCRHYALLGTKSDISPIHWQYGAIARLKKDESIDKLLYGSYSTISLGYIGVYEVTKLMTGESHMTQKGHEFAIKLMKYLRETVEKWKKETNISFTLYATPDESLSYKFAKIDKEKFGTIKDITDKGYYTNSYHIDIKEKIDTFEKLTLESEFQKISSGDSISKIEISSIEKNIEELENIVKFIYNK